MNASADEYTIVTLSECCHKLLKLEAPDSRGLREMLIEIALVFAVVYTAYFLITTHLSRRYLPPGPWPLPVIGNLHLVGKRPHEDLAKLALKYGDVFSMQLGQEQVVVLNSYDAAREALVKRGVDFAGRPNSFIGKIFSRDFKDVAFQTYNPSWKDQHKLMVKGLRTCDEGGALERHISKEVEELAKRLRVHRGKPINPRMDVMIAVANTIACIVFGSRFAADDRELKTILDQILAFVEGLASTSFIDAFPVFKFLPMDIINRNRRAVDARDKIVMSKFQEHKESARNGDTRDFLHSMIKENDATGLNVPDERMIMNAADLFIAGTETPTSTLMWVVIFLAKYPDIQKRLQKELDHVTGKQRVPSLKDKASLPYVEAFIAEVLRHVSIMPMAIPHSSIKASTLRGYSIPPDVKILLNLWGIHHNPASWHTPSEFKPERFLDENGHFSTKSCTHFMPYSFGRRSCPGEAVARTQLFLFVSQMAHLFEFSRPVGQDLPDVSDGHFGIVFRPSFFNVCITDRL